MTKRSVLSIRVLEAHDRRTANSLIKLIDKLDLANDNLGHTPLRQAVGLRLVEARLLLRYGHLDKLSGSEDFRPTAARPLFVEESE